MLPSSDRASRRARIASHPAAAAPLAAILLALLAVFVPSTTPAVFAATADTAKGDSASAHHRRSVQTNDVVIDENGIRIAGQKGTSTTTSTGGTPAVPATPAPPSPPADINIDVSQHGGDVVRFGEHVTVQKGESVAGDVVVIGGSLDVYGRVSGDVVSVGGDSITVHDGGVVNGQAVCVGGVVYQDEGAEIRGEVVSLNLGGPFGHRTGFRRWRMYASPFGFFTRLFSTVVALGVLFGLACLIMLVFGPQVDRVATALARDPLKSGAIGLLTVVALPPIIFLVAVTVIGIPAALVLVLAWFFANIFGMVAVSRATGSRIAHRMTVDRSPYLATGIGMLVLCALFVIGLLISHSGGLVPLPGWLFTMTGLLTLSVASVVGLGAVVTTRFGRRDWGTTPATPGPPPSPGGMPPVPPPVLPASPAPLASGPGEDSAAPRSEDDLRRLWDPSYPDQDRNRAPDASAGEGGSVS